MGISRRIIGSSEAFTNPSVAWNRAFLTSAQLHHEAGERGVREVADFLRDLLHARAHGRAQTRVVAQGERNG